jgi:hypothetical protein
LRSEGADFFERAELPAPSVSLRFLALNLSSPSRGSLARSY